MSSLLGQTVSHYRIIERLGGGGMGVVYKAEDTRLKRTVALKFLPPDLTRDASANRRFIHEAQAASSLEHSNICTIHEIGETPEGQLFITMACYEGETLDKRIERGDLAIREALGIAIQIARGITRAHEAGIIHRDIKPANIMLTQRDEVRILDFGLAKLVGQTRLTQTGSTLGTASYMSPEQARGEEVDTRTDIWSVGVVLYELLTGTVPFKGEFQPAVVYAILNETPAAPSTFRQEIPRDLETILLHALEKKPADRYQTMVELLADLEAVTSRTATESATGSRRIRYRRRWTPRARWLVGLAVVGAAVVGAALLVPWQRTIERNPDARLRVLQTPERISYPYLSPDGNWVAFGSPDETDRWDVYFMNTGGGEPRRVTHDSSKGEIFIGCMSPDGAWIFYQSWPRDRMEIRMVSSLGGQSKFIAEGWCPARLLRTEQRIMFCRVPRLFPVRERRFEIWSTRLDGSDLRREFADSSAGPVWSFSVSPDDRRIAWIKSFPEFSGHEICIRNRETGEDAQITFEKARIDEVFWTEDDYILYTSSKGGKFNTRMVPSEGGESMRLTTSPVDEFYGQLSADRKWLLCLTYEQVMNIRLGNLEDGSIQKLTSDQLNRSLISLSPDGRSILYAVLPGAFGAVPPTELQIVNRSGEGRRVLLSGDPYVGMADWSPDGRWIAYLRFRSADEKKVTLVSASDPGPLQDLGCGDELCWVDSTRLCWFNEIQMKTWLAEIGDPQPVQFWRDSAFAVPILEDKYVLFLDERTGREGWWIEPLAADSAEGREEPRKIAESGQPTALAPGGNFMLQVKKGQLWRITLPEGRRVSIPHTFPDMVWFDVSADGREIAYLEYEGTKTRLVLIENPLR